MCVIEKMCFTIDVLEMLREMLDLLYVSSDFR